jgi:molecular chaperone GrpE
MAKHKSRKAKEKAKKRGRSVLVNKEEVNKKVAEAELSPEHVAIPIEQIVPVIDEKVPESELTAPELDELVQKIAELENKYTEEHDKFLRSVADFDNTRKRLNREKQEAIDFANKRLLEDIIQIIDDFERAIKSAESSTDFTSFYEGIVMIEQRFSSMLENKWGLKRFDSVGEPFDPNRHEALMVEKSPDVSDPVVKEDLQKGYTLKDRVIRPARVKVLMPE